VTEKGPESVDRQSRAARRLARLFRIERNGGFERWPPAVSRQLIERRGQLIEAMLTDLKRQAIVAQPSAEVDRALAHLSREIEGAVDHVRAQLQQIGKDLRLSRGEGLPSGIRNSPGGHPLGKT
jgi:hypothetical protein